MRVTRRIDLPLLEAELADAGIAVPGLSLSGELPDDPGAQELTTHDADGYPVELPPGSEAVVDAHTAPPLAIEYSSTRTVDAILVTTDGTSHEILRFPCEQARRYRASLLISGIDRANWASLDQEGRFVWKRPAATVPAPGITVVSQIPTTPPAGWATNCIAMGTDVVFTVQGAAGRTIDWKLEGSVEVYAPGGLEG
jgi:hypothetical protein